MRGAVGVYVCLCFLGAFACGGNLPLSGAGGEGAGGNVGGAGSAGQGGSAGCVDLMTDDDNCGACGVRCGPTSTCQSGACGPAPITIVGAHPGCGQMDIAVSDGMLYWTERDHENVFSMPAAGGVTTTIVIADKNPEKIAAVGRDVFWVSSAVVLRHAWSSTNADDVAVSAMPIGGLAPSPDGRTVYFSSGAFVWPVPTTGGVRVVAQEDRPGALRALTLVGDGLAWLDDVTGIIDYAPIVEGQVARCGFQNADGTLDQTTCARLVRDRVSLLPEVILHAPGAVIWANGENVEMKAIPSFLPETALGFETIASTNLGTVSGIAISATRVYFAASDPMRGVGTIEKAAIAPGQVPIRIARGQNGPRALAIGDTKVYWSTADCTIESQDL